MTSMEMKKGKVIKDIPENLVPTYTIMGWTLYKSAEIKERNTGFKFKDEKSENTTEETVETEE